MTNKTPKEDFYRRLVRMRARREMMLGGEFINDRGFRHIKNRDDFSGVTYAFWLITTDSLERSMNTIKKINHKAYRRIKKLLISSKNGTSGEK